MSNFIKNILVIITLLYTNYAFSLSSSSYLIANTAINLIDFDNAKFEFNQLEEDLTESDLHNQLLAYVNLDLLSEANIIANKIIKINEFNQEAWIIYFANAVIISDLSVFKKFKINQNKYEMDLVNYIFFYENGELKDNKLIAKSIFDIVQASVSKIDDQVDYKFLLFYLSVAKLIDPDFIEAYFYSAQIYQLLNNFSKAEFYYEQIPNNHNLFLESQKNIAINKNDVGLHFEGVQILKNLMKNNEKNLNIIIALADLYRIQKNYKDAIKYYTKIINLKNNSFNEYWKIFYLRGICYERLKNWEFAENDFINSLKIKSNSPQVLNYLAYGWLERDLHLDKATKMLKEAYQTNPESFYIADSLAWAFYKSNQFLKAADLMEKVIIMAPGEAISLDHLGDIYFALNRKREASYFWKQALDLAEPEDEINIKIIKKLAVYNEG